MSEKFIPNPKEIPENIVPVQREEDEKPSFVDIYGDQDPEDVIKEQERIDSRRPPTLH
jgi:hypothetical protein